MPGTSFLKKKKKKKGVNYTKYVLLRFIQYMHCSKIGLVQNAVNLSKILFSASYLFMHIFNMSVIHLPSIKRIC